MKLTSPVFQYGDEIPQPYGRDFNNINPPLEIHDVPPGTRTLALIMEDPDVPAAAKVPAWDHWVVFNIPPSVTTIPSPWLVEGVRGVNTNGELEYGGPRPPDREHRYFIRVYAVNDTLPLAEGATKEQVLAAMEGKVIDSAELMGRFEPAT